VGKTHLINTWNS